MATDRQNHLLQTAYNTGITSPKELANFMAQVGHESRNLSRLNESFRYTQSAEQVSAVVRSAMREGRERLEEARRVAEDATASKTRFLAAASHDLLQPLHAARLFIAALKEENEIEQGSTAHTLAGAKA